MRSHHAPHTAAAAYSPPSDAPLLEVRSGRSHSLTLDEAEAASYGGSAHHHAALNTGGIGGASEKAAAMLTASPGDGGLQASPGGIGSSDVPFQSLRHVTALSHSPSFSSAHHSRAHSRRSSIFHLGGRTDWTLVSLAFRTGALTILAFWVLWDCVVDTRLHPSANNFWIDGVLPLYRASGFVLLAYWMWGVNVFIWRRFHINYMFLLELHPRTSDTHRRIFSNATTLSIVLLANFLLYFKMVRGDFPAWGPPGIWPMLMFLLLVGIMLPWPGCGTKIKQWPKAFGEVLLAPLRPVKFLHVFIGDVLTSLVKPGIDCAYALCFLGTGLWLEDELTETNGGRVCLDSDVMNKVVTPILSALPLWLRLMQCLRRYFDTRDRFPHMVNAGKYATAQSVVLVGVYHASLAHGSGGEKASWIMCLAASTMYSYLWDVFMDWDLGKRDSSFLRPDLMYGSRTFYYTAIMLDLFFRFIWTLTFVPASVDSPLGSWYVHSLTPVVAACEILRRGVWAVIRVENEHLQQVVQHQRAHDTSLLGDFDQADLEHEEVEQEEAEHEHILRQKGWKLLLEIAVLVAVVVSVAVASYLTH